MLDSLKKTGEKIGHGISRAWDSLSEGWRELLSRSSESLTKFTRHKEEAPAEGSAPATFPSWSLLAGELEETGNDVLERIELPGMDRDDCQITIEGNTLYLSAKPVTAPTTSWSAPMAPSSAPSRCRAT